MQYEPKTEVRRKVHITDIRFSTFGPKCVLFSSPSGGLGM
jgi:hypothetical protein